MPCYDPRSSTEYMQRDIDDLTDKLCKTLKHIHNNHPEALTGLSPDVLEWMVKHRKWDIQRGDKGWRI